MIRFMMTLLVEGAVEQVISQHYPPTNDARSYRRVVADRHHSLDGT
jgi:hypothetical protein